MARSRQHPKPEQLFLPPVVGSMAEGIDQFASVYDIMTSQPFLQIQPHVDCFTHKRSTREINFSTASLICRGAISSVSTSKLACTIQVTSFAPVLAPESPDPARFPRPPPHRPAATYPAGVSGSAPKQRCQISKRACLAES